MACHKWISIDPGKDPVVHDEKLTYEVLKAALGGAYFEAVNFPIAGQFVVMYLDENGKHKQLPLNIKADALASPNLWPGDFIAGPVVIAGGPDMEGDETDLKARTVKAITG